MNSQIKQKPVITIWEDNKVLKANVESDGRSQIINTGIERYIKDLASKEYVSKLVSIKDFSVEYEDRIVKFKNFKSLIKYDAFLQFCQGKVINLDAILNQNTLSVEKQRVKTLSTQVKQKKKNVLPDDYLDPISEAFKKRKRETMVAEEQKTQRIEKPRETLKVNRKKKRGKRTVQVTAFIAAVLVARGMIIASQTDAKPTEELPKKEEAVVVSVEKVHEEVESFKPDIDITTVIQDLPIENKYLSYENNTECDKALFVKNNYGELIESHAKKCGIDPNLVIGIATHESGDHNYGLRAGNRGGLMQIEMSYWNNKEIEYYDFDDKETYVIKITEDAIKEPSNNILIGCAILQNELRMFNYNILLSTLSYNQGYGNVNKILSKTASATGMQKMDLINNHDCLSWLDYTWVSGAGDPNYLQNVLQYTGFGYDIFEFSCIKENGDIALAKTGPVIYESTKTI